MIDALEVQRRPATKKHSSCTQNPKGRAKARPGSITIGMDLEDKASRYCELDASGETIKEGSAATTKKAMTQVFGVRKRCRIAMGLRPKRAPLAAAAGAR